MEFRLGFLCVRGGKAEEQARKLVVHRLGYNVRIG